MRNQGILCSAAYRRCLGVGLTVIALTLCAMVVGTATASAAPTCPEGSTYNKETKQCERLPTAVCPAGSSYDPATGVCGVPVTRSCESGATYNSTTQRCETPLCPPGAYVGAINETEGSCREPVYGSVYSASCPSGYTLDQSSGQCYQPASESCAEGQTKSGDVCILGVPQFACPQGYGYNTLTGKCQTPPTKGTKT